MIEMRAKRLVGWALPLLLVAAFAASVHHHPVDGGSRNDAERCPACALALSPAVCADPVAGAAPPLDDPSNGTENPSRPASSRLVGPSASRGPPS
jgi:hypothetical protein